MQPTTHRRTWILTGGISGMAGILAYFGAAFLPLPHTAALLLAFAFGPLIAVAALGLPHALHAGAPRVGSRIAAFFGAAAGIMVLAMLCVQQVLFTVYADLPADDPARPTLIARGDAVHLGLDIAWDLLIATSIVLFAVQMWRAPRFGKVPAVLGMACGALLLGINMAAFPQPPDHIDWFDMGPLCALWMLGVYVQMVRVAGRTGKCEQG